MFKQIRALTRDSAVDRVLIEMLDKQGLDWSRVLVITEPDLAELSARHVAQLAREGKAEADPEATQVDLLRGQVLSIERALQRERQQRRVASIVAFAVALGALLVGLGGFA